MTRNVIESHANVVRKQHRGDTGPSRARTAATALAHAATHHLQVPRVVEVQGSLLVTAAVPEAVGGDELLGSAPSTVLHAIGSIARQLHALPLPTGFDVPSAGPAAWVHGDLCPVNMLFGRDHVLRAVVDWEDSHVGDPLVDLAWTEWLVRAWHPPAVEALPVLYAAYSRSTPSATARRAAMRRCLTRHRDRADQTTDWDAHLAALDGLDLDLVV